MTVVLGINAFHAGASAALLIDGRPVVALAEERLNRVKYYAGFPTQAIRACLDYAGLHIEDIDAVALGRNPRANRVRKLLYAAAHPMGTLNYLKMRRVKAGFANLQTLFACELGVDRSRLRFRQYNVEHHLAHLASAYFISPWERSAGLSVDGAGDFVACMLAECDGPEIRVVRRVFLPQSLGVLYTMVCQFIGYDKYGDEGKVMGLAPLGGDDYLSEFESMVKPTPDGYRIDQSYFLPIGATEGMTVLPTGEMHVERLYSDKMIERFGEPRRARSELSPRDMSLAYALQSVFTRAYLAVLRALYEMVSIPNVALAGGCALNSVANGMIFDETAFTRTVIQPAAGDDGLALGAALYVSNSVLRGGQRFEMTDAYLGLEFSECAIRSALDAAGVRYERHERDALIRETVDVIERGDVVGWFQGRMEWGPRALGNRSILTHPGLPGMKETLNARIKHREWFRPFAPAVLVERQAEIFEHSHPSPFMLHVYKIRPEWRERLSAVTHVDGTGRLQSVARDENAIYYDLIEEFYRRTGIPVLLNTSFNENEPIVNTPAEAIDCFQRTKMDALVIGPFICRKDQS